MLGVEPNADRKDAELTNRVGELSTLTDEALLKAASFAGEICQVQGAFGHGLHY